MHDEASLRRLEEMGIDVYLPRDAGGAVAAPSSVVANAPASRAADAANAPSSAIATPTKDVANTAPRDADVLLLSDTAITAAEPLLAAVARTLAYARTTCARASADDAAALAAARALVVFGEAQARAAGAALSAQRQSQIGWVVAAEVARLRGDALGKRALWGELKRVVRLLRAPAR
jgi:DNA polymerase III psi subunit